MASELREHLANRKARDGVSKAKETIEQLVQELKDSIYDAEFHGDMLLGDTQQVITGYRNNKSHALAIKSLPSIGALIKTGATGGGLNVSPSRLGHHVSLQC